MTDSISQAIAVLQQGGIIAYPTEYCFGLGCDPARVDAIERILAIKQRARQQGLILIASDYQQVAECADLSASPFEDDIRASWPGPTTWLLATTDKVSDWVTGQHDSVAIRMTAHATANQICAGFGAAIISTSANRHAQAELLSADQVREHFADTVDYIVDLPVGDAQSASEIRDGRTGKRLR